MPVIHIELDGNSAFDDIAEEVEQGRLTMLSDEWRLATLAGGMKSGKPSVVLLLTDEDGNHYFTETSVALWLTTAAALKGRYGDPPN